LQVNATVELELKIKEVILGKELKVITDLPFDLKLTF
jgi:hypothetical protein